MLTEIITIYAISDDLLKAMGHREDPHYLATADALAKAETKAEVIFEVRELPDSNYFPPH
jgi:hypothetical protein